MDGEDFPCNVCNTVSSSELTCSACHAVVYCSKACQRKDWNGLHKQLCGFLKDLQPTELKLDAEETLEFDALLKHAVKNMKSLKHVSMDIEQQYLLDNDLGLGGGIESDDDDGGKVLLSASVLETFFRECTKLESVRFVVGDCCWKQIRKITKQGKVFAPLGEHPNIKSIHIRYPCFRKVDDLVLMLNTNLKVLKLDYLTLGPKEIQPWTESASLELVDAIGSLPGLVTLSLEDSYLKDSHLEILLKDLRKLRCLSLTGSFGDSGNGSYLTDEGARTIARLRPKLVSLDLSYQRRITTRGVEAVLTGCPSLKELQVSDCRVPAADLPALLSKSSSLLYLRWGGPFDRPSNQTLDAAVAATGGRTMLVTFNGLYEPRGLSAEQNRAQARNKQLLEEAWDRAKDPSVWNEWKGVA